MEATLEYTLNIDKTDWSLVRFGDVVQERRDSTKDPIADGVKHVVGLEHIDPENIHLINSGTSLITRYTTVNLLIVHSIHCL